MMSFDVTRVVIVREEDFDRPLHTESHEKLKNEPSC